MNVATLYEQVALLGFEDTLENIDAFYHAANRAIYQVNLLRPHIAECRIFRHIPKNLVKTDFSTIVREDDIMFEAAGARAYYFEVSGKGTLWIEEKRDGGWHTIGEATFEHADFTAHRGFIKAGDEFTDKTVRLRFAAHRRGNFTYFLRNIALYDKLYGAEVADIPELSPFSKYEMTKLAFDFLSFADPPVTAIYGTRMAEGYRTEGESTLLLPYEATGEFKILYRRKPYQIFNEGEPANDTTEIDLDEELCTLLPLLTASYTWIEDEPEKAEYYMNLYRERSAEITRARKHSAPSKIINVTGW